MPQFNLDLFVYLSLLCFRGVYQRGSLWDKVVFGKIQELLGGRVRIIVSGSAPLAQDIMRFYRIALGCPFLEGYGQTETTAAATFTVFEETHAGVVGPPLPCVMIKLVDVPELGYFGAKDEGEVSFEEFLCHQSMSLSL